MHALAFTLNTEAFATWKPAGYIDPLGTWDPRERGEENAVLSLVDDAQLSGIITWPFADVLKAEISYSYSDDKDGGAYAWTLDLDRADIPHLRLTSSWRDRRKIVRAGRSDVTRCARSCRRPSTSPTSCCRPGSKSSGWRPHHLHGPARSGEHVEARQGPVTT